FSAHAPSVRCISACGQRVLSDRLLGERMESKTKLLDQMRHVLRLKHMSIRTEKAYVQWAKRFILLHHKRHPADMGAPEIRAFLIHLAVEGQIAASTHN